MKPENTFNLLAHLAETPLVNPDEEVHVSELARTLGNIGCSDLHRLIKNEPELDQYFRFRRRGRQPGAFQSVGTLATEGAVKLAEMAIGRSKKINWSVKDAPGVVAAAQYEYRQYLWQHKLRTTLATTAIQAFVTRREDLPDLSEPTIAAEPAEPPARAKARQLSADGAASARSQLWRLDPSYRLSGRGTRWAEAAACISMDADLFDHPKGDVLKTVQDACKGCAVKGDCLLFHIEVPTDGFRAGFSKKMRDRMTTPEIVDWLRSSKPSTPQKK